MKNKFFVTFFFQTTNIVLVFLQSLYITKNFGPESNGLISLFNTSLNILYTFLGIGLANSLIYHSSKEDNNISTYVKFGTNFSIIISIISSFIILYLNKYQNLSSYLNFDRRLLLIICFTFPMFFINSNLAGILLVKSKYFSYNIIKISPVLISLFSILILQAFFKYKFLLLVYALFCAHLFTFFILMFSFGKDYFISKKNIISKKKIFKYGLYGYAGDLINLFTYRGDILILNMLLSLKFVGIYSLGVSFSEVLLVISNTASIILFPLFSNLSNKDSIKTFLYYFRVIFYFGIMATILILGSTYYVLPKFFPKIGLQIISVILVLIPGVFFLSLSKIISAYLMGVGKPSLTMISAIVSFILIITLDFILIPKFQIIGAAFASLIGYSVGFIFSASLLYSQTQINIFKNLFIVEDIIYDTKFKVITIINNYLKVKSGH